MIVRMREERAEVLEGGRLRWVRKATKTKAGGPRLILPAELKSWGGRDVVVELLSPREIILRLVDEEGVKE